MTTVIMFSVVRRLSSVYFDFSVNYQRLMFPLLLSRSQPTDLGMPLLIQIRSNSLISARGKVKQDLEGRARNTELDFRYLSCLIFNLTIGTLPVWLIMFFITQFFVHILSCFQRNIKMHY